MHIVLDFDGTLTERDTIGALARAAIVFQSERGGASGSRAAWTARWQAIVDAYAADYQAHCAAHPLPAAHDEYDDNHHDYHASSTVYASLRAVERRSVQRVEAAGLFAGMDAVRLEAAGRAAAVVGTDTGADTATEDRVELRRGVTALFAAAAARRWPVSILSVNWSDAWVRGVLRVAMAEAEAAAAALPIRSNTTTDGGRIVRNGCCPVVDEDDSPLLTADDKLAVLRHSTETATFLYVGDSRTDLACLVHASSVARARGGGGGGGIVLAGAAEAESALVQTLCQMGYSVPHVSGPGVAGPEYLAWAHDLDEVVTWVNKSEEMPAGNKERDLAGNKEAEQRFVFFR